MDEQTRVLSVTDGRDCIGHLIDRGREGVEAFTADEKSLGVFESAARAATACWKHAHHQSILETV